MELLWLAAPQATRWCSVSYQWTMRTLASIETPLGGAATKGARGQQSLTSFCSETRARAAGRTEARRLDFLASDRRAGYPALIFAAEMRRCFRER